MGNKARAYISVNSSVLGSASITSLNAADITISNSLTTKSVNTDQLVVNGNDVTQVLQAGGSLTATSVSGTSATISDTLTAGNIITNSTGVILTNGNITNHTITIDLNSIQQPGNYTPSPIVNSSPSAHMGYISVSLTDNTNLKGSLALYTRGKMWNVTVYTVLFEKNTDTDSSISLNTDNGLLTISTINHVTFEIKALNLFEK
jgi:hypothetical protein